MLVALGLAIFVALLGAPWLLLLVDAPLWAPLTLDLAVLVLATTLAVARWITQRSKPRPTERAAPPKPARPDQSAELDEIRRELDLALGAAARSRLAAGGRHALMTLPWYAIVGAPGSGKSALVRGSGLTFPTTPRGDASPEGSARGIGVTKRCDVWLGNEAVLLDTSGRWAVAEEDAEWGAFLDRLGKHRSARALDGVLVTLALDQLVAASEAERAALARHLRARIEAVSTRLSVAVPVYVIVTKSDRLVGFSEAFAGLDRRERARPWGFTLESSARGTVEELVRTELDTLANALRARTTTTLANERRVEARAFAAELPTHFAHVIEPLTSMLGQIFVASVYGETPTLRGVYFTSATQEGRPVAPCLSGVLRESGIEPPRLAEPTLEPRSYFVHQVLTRIVFADAETAAPSTRAKRRRAVAHVGTGVVAAGVSCALVIASACSWYRNRRAIDVLAEAVEAVPGAPDLAAPDALAALAGQVGRLEREATEGAPLWMRFGLDAGDGMRGVARDRYLASLRAHVLLPLLAAEASELDTWGAAFETDLDREPEDDERSRALVLLERQLRFGSPAEAGEPPLDPVGRARVARALADAWCGSVERPVAECSGHTALLLRITDTADRPRVERRESAIRRARLGLSRVRADRAALDGLVEATTGRGYDLTLASMVGTTGHALTSDRHVRGAFTRHAWEEVIRNRIDTRGDDPVRAWVLAETGTHRDDASREALRRAYFQAYAEEWRAFLGSVRVASPSDATESLALLEDLTRGTPPPIGRLLVATDDNVHLAEPDDAAPRETPTLLGSLTTQLTSARPEAPRATDTDDADVRAASVVDRALEPYTRFAVHGAGTPADAPLGVDVYGDELDLLRDALATYRDDPTSAGALETRLVAARRRVDGLVTEQAPGARDFFERVLRPPVEAAAVTSSRAMASSVAGAFCAAVVTPFSASLAGRYPFSARGDDAPLGEVATFYRPGGTLWAYYDASLAPIAPRAGASFALARRLDGGTSAYTSQLPTFLARSQAITSGLFPPGSSEPRIELDLRVHPTPGAASVRFSVGGTTVDYRNGPETWSRIVWPGAAPAAGARLEVESARGLSERIAQEGEWGLFRLVEAAVSIDARPGERTRTLRWHLPGHDVDVVVDVRPVRTECALFGEGRVRALGPLRQSGVTAPRHIARAGGECAP